MSGAFFTPTNRGRVLKMIEIMGHLEVSAKSNRASQDDWSDLLAPLTAQIAAVCPSGAPIASQPAPQPVASAAPAEPAAPVPASQRQARWADVREMAQQASLSELTYAMAVYLNRIDEHLKG